MNKAFAPQIADVEAEQIDLSDLEAIALPPLHAPPAAYAKKLPDPAPVYVVDFFAGCGGMSYGFANTRQSHTAYKVLAGIDIDREALKTYERNVVGSKAVHADIFAIGNDPDSLLDLVPGFDPEASRPLVFIGCAPCQGFSAHRKKDDRDDPRNSLMVAFAKICDRFKPDAIVMENVPEIIEGRYSAYFREAAALLRKSGYTLTQDVLDLSLYGVPQRRRRAIVVGSLHGVADLPAPVFTRETAPTVRHAIAHLNPIEAGEADTHDPFHRAPKHIPRILERIRKTPPDGGDRRALGAEDQLDCHTNIDGSLTPGFTDVYGRLRWDTPSVTITAKSSTPSCGRFLHPEQHRNISVREAAILQGFPQSYVFEGAFIRQYRQIGEAVPPLFAKFVAWSILDHLSPKIASGKAQRSLPIFSKKPARSGSGVGLSVVDGFCGAGGIALGFKAAGYETAFAFDIDKYAVETFAKNVSEQVEQLDVGSPGLVSRINKAIGTQPYVIAGGAPCQGFSQQRRGEDDDPRNNLVLKYAHLVGKLKRRPAAVLLENVTYLDSPRGRAIFQQYVREIEELGYRVIRHDLNSADFGVPQLRRRIIVVALDQSLAEHYRGPVPLTAERWPTIGEALADLPDVSDTTLLGVSVPNHMPSLEGELNKRRIAYVDMGQGRMAIPQELQLSCHTRYGGHLDVYGRLDWFSQARTITGGFDSFTRGEYAHPFLHRSITPREAARIQGFPDWFDFQGKRAAVRQQIGNAVPPPMAFAVAKAIGDAFRKARRKS
jgi:DNA-cytosine methyltransferase